MKRALKPRRTYPGPVLAVTEQTAEFLFNSPEGILTAEWSQDHDFYNPAPPPAPVFTALTGLQKETLSVKDDNTLDLQADLGLPCVYMELTSPVGGADLVSIGLDSRASIPEVAEVLSLRAYNVNTTVWDILASFERPPGVTFFYDLAHEQDTDLTDYVGGGNAIGIRLVGQMAAGVYFGFSYLKVTLTY